MRKYLLYDMWWGRADAFDVGRTDTCIQNTRADHGRGRPLDDLARRHLCLDQLRAVVDLPGPRAVGTRPPAAVIHANMPSVVVGSKGVSVRTRH